MPSNVPPRPTSSSAHHNRRWDGGDSSRIDALRAQLDDGEDNGAYVVAYALCALSGFLVGVLVGALIL
jgi:hypothetical protein